MPMQLPKNEAKRIIAIRQFQLKNAKPSSEFALLAQLAVQGCNVESSSIAIIGADKVWNIGNLNDTPLNRHNSIDAWAITQDGSIEENDLTNNEEVQSLDVTQKSGFYAAVPLLSPDNLVLGVLSIHQPAAKTLSDEERAKLIELAGIITGLLTLKHSQTIIQNQQSSIELYQTTIKGLNKELVRLSITDDLTQLHNMRSLRQKLNSEIQRSRRYDTPLSLLIIDLDNFKQFNEAYGHHEGDIILQIIARVLCNNTRETDIISRYGGEEFVIVMPYTDIETAHLLADRLRIAVEKQDSIDHNVTVSVGACQFGDKHENDADLIGDAEEAVQIAKRKGRNCVAIYEHPEE